MQIVQETIIGEISPDDAGKVPWQAHALRAVANYMMHYQMRASEPTAFGGTWDDGTEFRVSFEPPEPAEPA